MLSSSTRVVASIRRWCNGTSQSIRRRGEFLFSSRWARESRSNEMKKKLRVESCRVEIDDMKMLFHFMLKFYELQSIAQKKMFVSHLNTGGQRCWNFHSINNKFLGLFLQKTTKHESENEKSQVFCWILMMIYNRMTRCYILWKKVSRTHLSLVNISIWILVD